jgi:ergothioneine biosynthesis protein EgtB
MIGMRGGTAGYDSAMRRADAETSTLLAHYRAVRSASSRIASPLSAEDQALQSMPDASPTKWHLAHTSWFFETFVLEGAVAGYRPFDPSFRVLFNSYYQSVGAQYSRPKRGLLSRPSLDEVHAYRRHVDRHLEALLQKEPDLDAALRDVVVLGLHHEQQHQELILTDVKHLLAQNPLLPAYAELPLPQSGVAAPLAWVRFDEGLRVVGHADGGFCFDNETPAHRVFLNAFELATRPVTNGEYLAFVAAGGYAEPRWWVSDGFAAAQERGWQAPLYWFQSPNGDWKHQTLAGPQPVRAQDPVCHLSWYEADAYARFAGARLPTEFEWETAAADAPLAGNLAERGWLQPRAPERSEPGLAQLYGDVWEWTGSPYSPYPGYRPLAGALGEYNGKFMANQMTLRVGSCATPASHIRGTYRNFFPPDARWQFTGLRLARDAT